MIAIDKFKEYFNGHESEYVIIGGTACQLVMEAEELSFRATKDIDMVLIVESLTKEFGEKFWYFVHDAGYQHINRGTGKAQFYRFSHPKSFEYPSMIELFSKRPEWMPLEIENRYTPISITESAYSLSAILLDDEYYNFLKNGAEVIGGLPVLKAQYIIPFKAKAWLDLVQRKDMGEHIDSRDIKKHKNDVFRLSVLLTPNESVLLIGNIKRDMEIFLEAMERETVELKQLGVIGITKDGILKSLHQYYKIEETISI